MQNFKIISFKIEKPFKIDSDLSLQVAQNIPENFVDYKVNSVTVNELFESYLIVVTLLK